MSKWFGKLLVLATLIIGVAIFVQASSPFDIEFPIPELSNCADKEQCKAYCDDLAHKNECVEFARKHGLVSENEVEKSRGLPSVGPGGCQNERDCRAYCEDPSNLDECIRFGEKHGLISKEEVKQAREFSGQTGPGGCRGANECRAYCEDPAHQEGCLEFAHRKGLISDRDAEVARRITKEGGPGGCGNEKECRAYCDDPAHIDECLEFAKRHQFITDEEAQKIKKVVINNGPGGCNGAEECRAYCEDSAHHTECIDWAVQNGFMEKEEAERARKFAGKEGPGGCRGAQCREFCENPDNAEQCLEFAEREGLMPAQELERAKKFMRAAREGGPGGCKGAQCRNYCEDPSHQKECFNFVKKQGLLPPGEEKKFEAGIKIQQKMRESGGPGGCRTDDECRTYCIEPSHVEECIAFGAAHSGLPEEEMRQLLRDFTERRLEAHGDFRPPEDFKRFEDESRKRFEEFRQLEEHFRGGQFEFPGGSGGFPGGQGGFPGGPGGFSGRFPEGSGGGGFTGPGGCASPEECIKYCFEHKEECFSFGPPGQPQFRPGEGGVPPGHDFPQLRDTLLRQDPTSGSSGSLRLTSIQGSDGRYLLLIRAQPGVQDFNLVPSSGSNYGGGVPGCQKEFKSEVTFPNSAFPMKAYFTDCNGKKYEFEIPTGSGSGGDQGLERPAGFRPPVTTDESGLREKLQRSEILGCVARVVGEERARALREGSAHFDEFARQALFKCVEGFGGVVNPPTSGFPKPCPAMPTVDSCPSGQKKVVAFESSECGVYYSCVPEYNSGTTQYPTYDPAKICAEKGGRWDVEHCVYPEGTTTTSPPPTYDPAHECQEKGGVWDGSMCKVPEVTPQTSAPRKGFFASIIEFFWPR